jgi:hypothetical protein
MEKRTVKYLIDIGLLVSGILCMVTGVIKLPVLLNFFDIRAGILPVYQITLVHDWSGVIFVVLIIAHVSLNWRWMVGVTKTLLKKKK